MMKTLPDYSTWLHGKRYRNASEHWERDKLYLRYARELKALCEDKNLRYIMELGCGDGWIPRQLSVYHEYVGVDQNPEALTTAREANPDRIIIDIDIREVVARKVGWRDKTDVVCSFAVLKHFGLHEWSKILSGMLHLARYAVFSIPLAKRDRDDGEDFHHVWISGATLRNAVAEGGHKLFSREPYGSEPDVDQDVGREVILFTKEVQLWDDPI